MINLLRNKNRKIIMAISDINMNDIKNLDEVGLPALVYQIMYYEIANV